MARLGKINDNAEILSYALMHLEKERDAILAKIAHINQQLGVSTKVAAPEPLVRTGKVGRPRKTLDAPVRQKRELSEAARKRISLAQKKRWAASRKSKGE